jgi:beta-galactosidase
MTKLAALHFTADSCEGPCFYRFTMDVPEGAGETARADTFLDTHGVAKGIAFLNARPLGRFWDVGPEFTLYTPGPWLHQGANEIVLFDLKGSKGESLSTVDHADYGTVPAH